MPNVYMDLLKNKSKNADNPLKGVEIRGALNKLKYDVQKDMPYGDDVAQGMRRSLGDKPKRGWRALLDGMITGFEAGGKARANDQKRKELEKFKGTFEYLEGVAQSATQQDEASMKKRQIMEEMNPSIKNLAQYMGQLPYEDIAPQANSVLNTYNEKMGTDYKIDMIDTNNKKILLKSPNGGQERIDLLSMFPEMKQKQEDDWYLQKALQTQEAQDRRAEQQLLINQKNADAIESRVGFSQDPHAQFDVKLGAEQAKGIAQMQAKLSEQNVELENVSYTIQDLKDILKTSEVITGDTLASGFERILGKQLGTKAYSDTELYDSISQGLLSFVKGNVAFGNMNQKEFEFLTSQTPGSHKTKAALDRMLDRFGKTLDRQMKRNEKEINAAPRYGARIAPQGQPQQAKSEEMVKIKRPDGILWQVPASSLDAAIAHGATVVE